MGLHILVLAGGSGTRLWPLSRAATPKHLLPIGPGGATLLRTTVERVRDLGDTVHVVTEAAQAAQCVAELETIGLGPEAVIAEPVARGTGPALGLATAWIQRADPEALIVSVHADSEVGDDEAYRAAVVASAGWAAATGGLATVGLTPPYPSTGMGYIETGAPRDAAAWTSPSSASSQLAGAARLLPAYEAAGFREKPDRGTAEEYFTDGRHLWNLALFAWPARSFLAELGRLDPALGKALEDAVEARAASDEAEAAEIYAAQRSVAVDPLVMERTSMLTVVRAAFRWSDLGSWGDLLAARVESGAADVDGNVVDGDAVLIDATDCTVVSRGGRLVSVIGAADLVVVDTLDALLVVPVAQSQRVKELVERLRAEGRTDLL